MDPYAGLNFGGEDRPSGMFFVDFGLGDTLGGLGPIVPFLAVGGMSRYLGGAKAYGNMLGKAGVRGMRAGAFGSRVSNSFTGTRMNSLTSNPLGGMYEITGGKTYVGGNQGSRLTSVVAREAQWISLQSDIRKVSGGSVPGQAGGRKVMAGLYDNARRNGYDIFSRYGAATGGRVAAAGLASTTFRFLEGIALLTLGQELGRGVAQSIADWEPARGVGPEVEFGDGGYAPSPAAAMTQRQRALSAIHNSQLGVRAALGNEASFIHS